MDIPGLTSSSSTGAAAASGFGTSELGQGAFLELFVAQLENQDPLDPVQNEQFVEQLATFSSLEQLETMNDSLVSMIALNQSNALLSQLTQSSGLIGQEVSYQDPTTGALTSGTVDTVKVVEGLAVLNIGGKDVPLALVSEVHGGEPETTEETPADE